MPGTTSSIQTALAIACVTRVAGAQLVRGIIVDSASRRPLPDVTVSLLGPRGDVVAGAVSDDAGRYAVRSTAGMYRLRMQRIGYRPVAPESIALALGATVRRDVAMAASPLVLTTMRAEARNACTARGTMGPAARALWEEVHTALDATIVTERAGLARLTVRDVERELDPTTMAVRAEQAMQRTGVTTSPYAPPPPESLSVNGYAQQRAGATWYYAPSATTLASDAFIADHCLWLMRDRASPDLLGVRFEPVRGRRVVDIQGTAWVDVATAELRSVDFTYTGLPNWARGHTFGGRVELGRIVGTGWIVRRWTVRAPRIDVVERSGFDGGSLSSGRVTTRREEMVIAIHEAGGEVLSAAPASVRPSDAAAMAWTVGQGTVRGTVFDSLTGRPLVGAEVRVVGTTHRASSDAAGAYAIAGVAAGRQGVTFSHGAVVASPVPRWVEVAADTATVVDLFAPSAIGIVTTACPSQAAALDTAVVYGIVRSATSNAPIAGVTISATWTHYARLSSEHLSGSPTTARATADSAGVYHICGVPTDVLVRLTVERSGRRTQPVSLVIHTLHAARQDLRVE